MFPAAQEPADNVFSAVFAVTFPAEVGTDAVTEVSTLKAGSSVAASGVQTIAAAKLTVEGLIGARGTVHFREAFIG